MRQPTKSALLSIVVVLLLVLAPSLVWGQQAKGGKKKAKGGKGNIIQLEEMRIEGRIQKPEAFYILQRSNLNYKSLELESSFVGNILDSVEKPPF